MFLGMIGSWQILLLLLFGVFGIILPVIALIDILKGDFKDNNKLIWVLLVVLMNGIGAILYFSIGRNQKLNRPV